MRSMKILFVLSSAIIIAACDTFWHRSSTIAVTRSAFPNCAYRAVSKFEELTLIEHYTKQGQIIGQTPYSMFEIELNEYGNAKVHFHGRGYNPLPEVDQEVNDLLSSLTRAVTLECNHS